METDFPTVGVLGSPHFQQALIAPAISLGITVKLFDGDVLEECDVLTIVGDEIPLSQARTIQTQGFHLRPSVDVMAHSREGEIGQLFVLVARSPHGQGATWRPMAVTRYGESLVLTSAHQLSEAVLIRAQNLALELARTIELIGVAGIGLASTNNDLSISSVEIGPSLLGDWSVFGSLTSQYEQHLRAILDLPLGDTVLTARFTSTGFFHGKSSSNFYRPYLHLMARTPALKVRQYLDDVSGFRGHISLGGRDLLELHDSLEHALAFMNGDIDE